MSPVREPDAAARPTELVQAEVVEYRPPETVARSTSVDRTARPTGKPRRRRSVLGEVWRWMIVILIFAVVASGLLGLSLVTMIYRQARIDQARPVDAVVVLGTAQFNGRPGRVLQARLDRALAVYEEGLTSVVVVTGGRAPGDAFTEAEAARDYLLERGVPVGAIVLENEGRDSWSSMRGVAALLDDLGIRRVLLVSDGFHLLRVKLMARDLGLAPFGTPAESPIRQGSGREFSYVLREAAGVVAHLWETRRG